MQRLPIHDILPAVLDGMRAARTVVLRAEPGAGKTTRVPAALLDADLAGGKEVLVVEPRRIAARAAAAYVARERGTPVGDEIGYRVRFERQGGDATRVWYVTEGLFTRQLTADPFLEDVGVVVLDEFHERHLDGDLALAVVRHLQQTVRPDLGLVIMSATLDDRALASVLPDAVVLHATGREFPVDVSYARDAAVGAGAVDRLRSAMPSVLESNEGDVLVFLAGARDIRRAADMLATLPVARGIDVDTLHGMQPLAEQQRVLAPGTRRRIVLATNVAETAVTVGGVTTVVDAGEARVARYDPRVGVNRLRVTAISKAAATQRAGRAGRTQPGRCIRLWPEAEHRGRRAEETPEVARLELSRLVLTIAAWGMASIDDLPWLTAPSVSACEQARELLIQLGALGDGGLSETGRAMLAWPLEPRLARVATAMIEEGVGSEGALWLALAGERDIVRRSLRGGSSVPDWPSGPSDLEQRAALFAEAARDRFDAARCAELGLDRGAVRTVDRVRRQLASRFDAGGDVDDATLRRCVLTGFPDRVARRRAAGAPRARMVGGAGVTVGRESVVREAELFVCLDVDAGDTGIGREARVRRASAVDEAWLASLPVAVREEDTVVWDDATESAVASWRRTYGDLVLAERRRGTPRPDEAFELLLSHVHAEPPESFLDAAGGRDLARLRFLAASRERRVGFDVDHLLGQALRAAAQGSTSLREVRAKPLADMLRGLLPPDVHRTLDRDAPTHVELPTGRRVPLKYHRDRPPTFAARIQEVFGLAETPRVAGGHVPVIIELLAPSRRPVQVTDDLASFWRTTYADVRRELRGRYPKHDWPEDPLAARPSSGPKRRR